MRRKAKDAEDKKENYDFAAGIFVSISDWLQQTGIGD